VEHKMSELLVAKAMESFKSGPKGSKTSNRTKSVGAKQATMANFVNISTKFNGIGGNTSSLAKKTNKVQPKLAKTGIFESVK